jgi:hypothetical protein
MSENKNIENSNGISRREALGTIGTALAATAVIGLANQTAQAQNITFQFVVDSYRAYLHSAPQYNWESRIYLFGEGKSAGILFMKDEIAIPANTIATNQLSANVYFPKSRFAEIRDFLRYEKPVRLTVVSNGIATLGNDDNELIGDLDI